MQHGFVRELVAQLRNLLFGLSNCYKSFRQYCELNCSKKLLTIVEAILDLLKISIICIHLPIHAILFLHDGHSLLDDVCLLGLSCQSKALKGIFVKLEDSRNSLALFILEVENYNTKLVALDNFGNVVVGSIKLI